MKEVIEIKAERPGHSVMVIAGVHGDEYEPMVAAMNLREKLAGRLLNGVVRIVPVTNESAYHAGSRFGSDGCDLARICPGDSSGSDSERAAAFISTHIRQADYLIDMHTGGVTYDIYPMAGYVLHQQPDVLGQQRMMAQVSGLPLIWGTDYRPNGRTLSVARDYNIPAVYFEYGGGTGFRPDVVHRYGKAVENILAYLGMLEPEGRADNAFPYWVEDHRPDSGHFQVKMPSPMDGIFMAQVSVGDRVTAGQAIGGIISPVTGERCEVKAATDGLVHFLRVVVKVQKGDALGGILPVKPDEKEIIYE